MDTNRLSQGEMIAAVSALLLLIVMFIFTWFSVDLGDNNLFEASGVEPARTRGRRSGSSTSSSS